MSAAAIEEDLMLPEPHHYLGIVCLALRLTSERPITITQGAKRLCTATGTAGKVSAIHAARWQGSENLNCMMVPADGGAGFCESIRRLLVEP